MKTKTLKSHYFMTFITVCIEFISFKIYVCIKFSKTNIQQQFMEDVKTVSHTIFPPAGKWNDACEKSHSIFPPAGSWDAANEKSHSIFPPAGSWDNASEKSHSIFPPAGSWN